VADLATLRLPPGQRTLPVYRTDVPSPLPRELPQRFLLESGRSGAGERADWNAAARLATAGELVLAGGLDATNVAAAIAAVRPFGIDVSSGVEAVRGSKDAVLIRTFIDVARAAHARTAAPSLGVEQT
jgi:phosphoribosylanthranilate isomerase